MQLVNYGASECTQYSHIKLSLLLVAITLCGAYRTSLVPTSGSGHYDLPGFVCLEFARFIGVQSFDSELPLSILLLSVPRVIFHMKLLCIGTPVFLVALRIS